MKLITNLASDNLKGLVYSLAIPSMLSQLVSVFYSIVDRMYIGNIENIGDIALAGVGVCGPIVTMVTSFAFLVGIGSSPLLSKSLGANKNEQAQNIVANAFVLILIIAFSVTSIAYVLKDFMLYSFGASDNLYPYANEYLSIYLIGIIFSLIATAMNQIIICEGFGKIGMFGVLVGAITNIILDPIFIFTLDMGVKGAAIATVISQFISCVYVLSFLFSKNALVRISFGGYKFKTCINILKIGLPSFLIVIFDNFMLIALNATLQKWGGVRGDMLLTCNTILQSFMLMVTMPLAGITGGTQTILGYNLGAKRKDKIIKAQKHIFILSSIFCAIMCLVAMTLSEYFVMIFTKTPEYIEMTSFIIKISTIAVVPLAIQYTIIDGFTALSMVKTSLILSATRKILYFILVFTLPLFLDIKYVFLAETISDIFPVMLSCVVYIIMMKRLKVD